MCLSFICLIYCFTSVKTAEVMSGQSGLTTLFHGKPTRGSLPVFIALHSFASNGQLALLKSAEGGNISLGKNVLNRKVDLGSTCIRSGHATDQATAPGNESLRMTQDISIIETRG